MVSNTKTLARLAVTLPVAATTTLVTAPAQQIPMIFHRTVGATALALACAVASPVWAAPTQWTVGAGANGHFYDLITGYSATGADAYANAFTNAQTRTFMGMQGYVVTITSAAENAFVSTTVAPNTRFVIGGSDSPSLGATLGIFRWIGGPEAGQEFYDRATGAILGRYNNWNVGGKEPNNWVNNTLQGVPGAEPYMMGNWAGTTTWNDSSFASNTISAYVIEYSSVPVPGTLLLGLAGFAALGAINRRKPR